MTLTDEQLSAYIDGELAASDMELIRRMLEDNDALSARLARLKRMDQIITAAYGSITDEPIPDPVLSLLAPATNAPKSDLHSDNIFPLPNGRTLHIPKQWHAPLAAAAALAVGVSIGLQLSPNIHPNRTAPMIAGIIDKSSPLHAALETAPSAQPFMLGTDKGGAITPVLTFKSTDGRFCREFNLRSSTGGQRALACRLDGTWVVQFAAATNSKAAGAVYSTASSDVAAQFNELIDVLIDDAPLDADEEAAIIEKQWKLEE